MKKNLLIILIIGIILFIFGVIGFFSDFIIFLTKPSWLTKEAELPLSDLREFAVDKDGNVYCATHQYDRIQVYDQKGHFLRGWFVPPHTRFIRIRINAANNLEVARTSTLVKTYDIHGNLLNEQHINPDKVDEEFKHRKKILHFNGSIYTLCNAFFIRYITKKDPGAQEKIFIKTSTLYYLIFPAPFPAFIFMFVGSLLLHFSHKRSKVFEKYVKILSFSYV